MSEPLRDRLREFASARGDTLATLTPFSQAQFDFSPGPRKWSIGEVADHIRLSEAVWRSAIARLVELAREGKPAYLKRSFADVNVSPLHLPDAVLSFLEVPLGIMSRFVPNAVVGAITEFPVLPTRNPDVATPRANRPGRDLIAGLKDGLAETRELVEQNPGLDFEHMVSEHPLTGATNVPQIVTFLVQHERRHLRQIERVRMDARFPRR